MATYNNIKKIKIGDNIFNLYDSGNSGGTITSVKTTAGAHTVIDVTSGAVSFNVPTKTSHLTNDSGFITTDTNTTYALSGTLSSHTFTSTLTAGGSGSGTSTSALTLAEGTGISLTDDTTNNKITVGHSNSVTAGTAGTSSATSGSTLAVPYVTYDAQGHITATGTHTHTVSGFVPTTRTVNGKALSANIADADYITEEGNKAVGSITWTYRRTNKGDTDAWATVSWSSAATSVWSSPVRYKDLTISIPSGIFSAAPRITATSTSTQYWVAGVTVSSATSATIRFATVATSNFAFQAYVYAFGS